MTELNLIVIKTNKIAEQFDFYSSLGIQFDYHKHGNGPYHYASIGQRPVIGIYPLPKGITSPDHTTRLGFAVEKLDLLIETLISKEFKIIELPKINEWGYSAIVQDIDGRKIELTEIPGI